MSNSIYGKPYRRHNPIDFLADLEVIQQVWRRWQDAPFWVRAPIEIICMLTYNVMVLAAQAVEWVVLHAGMRHMHGRVQQYVTFVVWLGLWGLLLWWLPLWAGLLLLTLFILTYIAGEIVLRYDSDDSY